MLCYVLKICNVYVQADEAKIRAELHNKHPPPPIEKHI